MLGLGNSLVSGGASSEWYPCDMSNLQLWLAFDKNITSDEPKEDDGSTHDHRSVLATMVDQDKINAWNAHGCTSINATQTTRTNKPLWETDAADIGAVKFSGGKEMALSSDVVLDANTDFTIAVRFKCTDFSSPRGIMGDTASEFIRISNNTTFRIKVNSTNRDFALASGTMATDEYYTLIIVRSDDSTGNLNVFIRGNESLDGTATGTQVGSELQDAGEITVDDIGLRHAGDSVTLNGFLKDILIWDGTAASSADRKLIFDYIEGQ